MPGSGGIFVDALTFNLNMRAPVPDLDRALTEYAYENCH
jgi:hypothetical protein